MQAADQEIRSLVRFSLTALFAAILVVAGLSYAVRFDVDLVARYRDGVGEMTLADKYQDARTFESETPGQRIAAGATLRTTFGSQARIEIVEGAFAYLNGAVSWSLADARRRATVLGHVQNPTQGEFHLLIEQTEGVVVYDFSNAQPPLADLNLILRFPDGEFTPTSVCFQASAASPESPSSVVDIPCWGQAPTQQNIPAEEELRLGQ